MRARAVQAFERVRADVRLGWGVPVDELVTAALVALPFAGFLGIWVGQATGWPSPVLIVLTGLFQGVGTYWIAGYRRRAAGGGSDHEGSA